ncbi:hypothetical protein [Tessaracoccus palaemonis]|uniref:Ig-like domain-containing protein n=1 Tax=Tessaracoccus palaemonis TaxID=2829499 RepID=A0ABX8SP95_9ACTN|nr:hypothetical protein [Tessaracoccus palaemonis]QXT63913.1 hypothetical protein KDB89_05495 [Tessaracoccus palaemonis]
MSVMTIPGTQVGVNRRTMLGAVWAAPVVVAVSTLPAFAASGDYLSDVTIVIDGLSDLREGGTAGPLESSGGHFLYTGPPGDSVTVYYSISLKAPNGDVTIYAEDVEAVLLANTNYPFDKQLLVSKEDIQLGTYTLTVELTDETGTQSISNSRDITIVA